MVYDINKAIRILEGNYKNSVLRHNGELLTVNELIAMLKAQEPIEPVKVNRYMDTDLEYKMKYYDEDMLRDTFTPEECEFFFNRHKGYELKIRFCRDCKYFECDGIQPEPGVIHGRCLYYTTEPPYLRVTDKNFCNEDNIIDGK